MHVRRSFASRLLLATIALGPSLWFWVIGGCAVPNDWVPVANVGPVGEERLKKDLLGKEGLLKVSGESNHNGQLVLAPPDRFAEAQAALVMIAKGKSYVLTLRPAPSVSSER